MCWQLMIALKGALQTALMHPRFINDRAPDQMAQVKVHLGQLPFKRDTPGQNDFPYVLIQPVEGSDGDESEATLRIHCGVFNDEQSTQAEAGAEDILNLIGRVRRTLLEQRFLDDHKRYRLKTPVKWRVGNPQEENLQPLPLNEGLVIATWNLPAPVEVPDDDVQAALGTNP